jgi:trans-aconitate methyltransferase
MIDAARSAFGSQATFVVGDAGDVGELGSFDAVVSVMVLQFVEDVRSVFATLTNSLSNDGVIVFAVHNPAYVERSIEKGRKPPYELTEHGRRTTLRLRADAPVPLYVRTAEEYDALLTECGFSRVLHSEPPFTQEFIDRFGV